MRLFIKKIIKIQNLNYIILILGSLFFFQSCTFSDKQGYNEGYKAGYTAGFTAASEKQNQSVEKGESKTEVADPNFNNNNSEEDINNTDASIPQKAIVVLNYIKEKNKAPDGYVGGRQFGNYEKHLPQRDAAGNKISYREWDIHPKVEGKNRGAQRLVTGSDGSAWYTADHYNSFTEISTQN